MRRLPFLVAASMLGAAFTGAGGAAPARDEQAAGPVGTLRGRVDIQRQVEPPGRRPRAADLAAPPPRDTIGVRPAVVYLEEPQVPERSILRSAAPEPGRARMDQRNETFVPGVLAVAAGSLVDFPNNDTTFHNVFSLSTAKRFDLGRYGRGRSETVRFDNAGIVRVFCDIHSHMSAFVLVFNHPFFATADADGRYRIDGIPSGTYTVTAWHEGTARDSRTVTIPPSGGTIDLDLLVR
jgi:plastocyanin